MDCPNPNRSSAVAAAACLSLPDDALVDVFSRLPVKCLHRSKCVCKRWRDIIADPIHSKVLPQTLVGFFNTAYDADEGNVTLSVRHGFVDLLGTSAAPPPLLDPSFPFLDELPAGIECTLPVIWDSCNGLLLFQYGFYKEPESMGYIVFNPATAQHVVVPGNWTRRCLITKAYLLFDPAVSSHFHILVFAEERECPVSVHAYSSRTRAWSDSERDWSMEEQHRPTEAWRRRPYSAGADFDKDIFSSRGVFVNGALYVHIIMDEDHHVIYEVDVEGKTQSIIPVPSEVVRSEDHPWHRVRFFGQSQGRVHCISHGSAGCGLSIWVIEDDGTTGKQWVLKHTVSCMRLFGRKCRESKTEYIVYAIHPDCDKLFILNSNTKKLIAYDVDSNRVRDLCTIDHRCLTPYVPSFMDLLSN